MSLISSKLSFVLSKCSLHTTSLRRTSSASFYHSLHMNSFCWPQFWDRAIEQDDVSSLADSDRIEGSDRFSSLRRMWK